MRWFGDGRPWISWVATAIVAYSLKWHYSRASVEDLAWVLEPTARAVGWLRGESLVQDPAGWMPVDGSYVIAPACAGVNFLILALTVSVLGFSHRLRSPGQRFGWWFGSLLGAWVLTIGVNTARILAAVELYSLGLGEQAHRLLGIVVYLGALWVLYGALDRLTGPRSRLTVLVPVAYLGMTLGVPLLTGAFRQPGGLYAEHAMMVVLVTLISTVAMIGLRRREKT
ncbi:MAG TPA: exosortase K [Thermoanaerobaculia bacterium]|jgi:exosortase K|nr:exosortase K [Thermoanaerobaculia bacterium]